MAKYKIFETSTFQKDMTQLTQAGLDRIKKKLQEHVYPQLRENPYVGPNIKRLKRWDPPTWRYRVGAWRFFYEIEEKEKFISMTVAEHRSKAY